MDNNDSALKLYLREISQIPLLTKEKEVELAKRIQQGDQEARRQMIQANLRLVVKIAHDYANSGLPLPDLISEGNIGLMKAVDRFDPSKGGKLSTYAAWWIKQSIKRALANQSKTIRLPVHLVDKIAKMRRVAMQLSEILGRDPTDEELAEELGMSTTKVAELRTIAIRPASLDATVGEEEDGTSLGELVKDESATSPDQSVLDQNLKNTIMELLPKLDERERKILSLRFGLEGNEQMTLEEIGKEFHVTRERIRQLQNIALRKIRKELEKQEKGKNRFSSKQPLKTE
ncbi:sigma-70 family RNA polymerase sigma factor [Methylacidiphilum caldifontis]|uniref:RNA polymerase sigma factor n=1 Tax=Methylacidiphilum caldifontis TaxID=2795386 RepID=A0A4Y8PB55_9BACT|nr:RNA polymerase sigma factor RpoD/SigA [Methylacidiphilum caldifontis]QSR88198.1 RNA polymerase sigma factor RpoD/SigA [Methylacidiphilum caldifontis]TFE68237.1 RNA polymerase subunit sigma [Methylacidiphilum caldifontis]